MDNAKNPQEFEIRRKLVQMEMLYEIGLALNQSLDLSYVAQKILGHALAMVDARCGFLLIRDADTGTSDVIGQVGLEGDGDALDEILQLEEVDRAWQTADLVQHRRGADIWRHLCIVPLKNPEQVNGLLIVADKEKRDRPIGPFDASDETLLQAFGNQAGIALHNARLHRKLEEAYAQVRQAQKMEIMGQLAAGLAHNFNNMLQVILGNVEIAIESAPGDIRALLNEARDVSYRASDIIHQLMIFSRRGPRAENKEVEIGPLLQNAIEICRKSFSSRTPIRVEIQPDLPPLQCDPGQLEQVILNLCINARDALADVEKDEGTVQLAADTCDARPAAETGAELRQRPCIRIRVSDNGPGMDDETRRRIFEPFFTTKDEDKGTGLGLSTVHTIVEQHAGWIDCKSRPGEGATFSVYLPLDEAQS